MGIAESFFCKKFEVRIYLTNSEIFLISHKASELAQLGMWNTNFHELGSVKVFIHNYLTNFHLTVNYNALLFRTDVF